MSKSSFVEALRKSRSTKTSIVHQFLTNYDPSASRFYLFVEGDPDRAFYRSIFSTLQCSEKVYVYNCEGKQNVYSAFREILGRYPDVKRALFFVDKDVDDIIGKPWPSDPRIFTTDVYSIENYVAVTECLEKHLLDHVKLRRVDIDTNLLIERFAEQQARFHRMATPIMAWIVAMRRKGHSVNLNDVNMAELFEIRDCTVYRRRERNTINYLERVTQVKSACDWRVLRATTSELLRLRPKAYIRGKFEAWWFVAFVADAYRSLADIARQGGGSSSQTLQVSTSNLIQVFAGSAPPVPALTNFAQFHCGRGMSTTLEPTKAVNKKRWWRFW
jgi:Protein of unknown function (DUF4435)